MKLFRKLTSMPNGAYQNQRFRNFLNEFKNLFNRVLIIFNQKHRRVCQIQILIRHSKQSINACEI